MSILTQVTFALAAAEDAYDFEHRDLHVSNILVKKTDKLGVEFVIKGRSYKVESCQVRASIIDMTFSRFTYSKSLHDAR